MAMIAVIIHVMKYMKYTAPIPVLEADSEPMVRVVEMRRFEAGKNMFQCRKISCRRIKLYGMCQQEYKKGNRRDKKLI